MIDKRRDLLCSSNIPLASRAIIRARSDKEIIFRKYALIDPIGVTNERGFEFFILKQF